MGRWRRSSNHSYPGPRWRCEILSVALLLRKDPGIHYVEGSLDPWADLIATLQGIKKSIVRPTAIHCTDWSASSYRVFCLTIALNWWDIRLVLTLFHFMNGIQRTRLFRKSKLDLIFFFWDIYCGFVGCYHLFGEIYCRCLHCNICPEEWGQMFLRNVSNRPRSSLLHTPQS